MFGPTSYSSIKYAQCCLSYTVHCTVGSGILTLKPRTNSILEEPIVHCICEENNIKLAATDTKFAVCLPIVGYTVILSQS